MMTSLLMIGKKKTWELTASIHREGMVDLRDLKSFVLNALVGSNPTEKKKFPFSNDNNLNKNQKRKKL